MRYAEVSVNSPAAGRRTFSYSVPDSMSVNVGQAVWVPFGEKVLQGVVIELVPFPAVEVTKDIIGVIETQPLLTAAQVSLSRWISEYYLSPLFDAVALMLPPGFERKAMTFLKVTEHVSDISTLTPEEGEVLQIVRKGEISLSRLEKLLGKKKAQLITGRLVKKGLLVRRYKLEAARVRPKVLPYLSLDVDIKVAYQEAEKLRKKHADKQAELVERFCRETVRIPAADARKIAPPSAIKALVAKRILKLELIEVKREPVSYDSVARSSPLNLTSAQESALDSIKATLINSEKSPRVFLLHGVTGSGKTEVYLQSLAEAVKLGKKGIVLVPEIALTPQTIERFASRFPGKVAVLHSRLSLGEQFDEWRRIKNREFDVVIGPRSAVFAPQPELGIIIIDEEHEWNYKQQDKSPRYHARDAAIKLAELTGAVVILGSATPDVESYYRAKRGDYHLLQLPERVTPKEGSSLPDVEVVDMRKEFREGNRSIFSRSLSTSIIKVVSANEQVILFLNRRGAASFVQCRKCGFILRCKRCELALSYHPAENTLTCHHCNYRTPVPVYCPMCSSRQIKYLGAGTQRLEQESGYSFPGARCLRWDSDAVRLKNTHQGILKKFRDHEADILIGTQMIAKGLDLPLVTLVGVVNADTSLNLPDFRAGERTFQLLSQVAGRAGRGVLGGRVIVQTFSPEHYAIQCAARHDYASFYNKEIGFRRRLNNPPFTRLALLVYTNASEDRCRKESEEMKERLTEKKDNDGADISIVGPVPSFIHKLRGRFRWQLVLRGAGLSSFLSPVSFPQGWTVEVDPVTVV